MQFPKFILACHMQLKTWIKNEIFRVSYSYFLQININMYKLEKWKILCKERQEKVKITPTLSNRITSINNKLNIYAMGQFMYKSINMTKNKLWPDIKL